MKPNSHLAWIVAGALLTASATGLAQQGPKNRPQSDRPRPANVERTYDRDRMQGHDRADQNDRQQDQDKAKAKDQVQQKDHDIYGYQLMSEQERNVYREQLIKAKTEQEQQQIMSEHRAEMQARAKAKGVDLEEIEESE